MPIIRPKINEVFTPRAAGVNVKMYIERPELENELNEALKTLYHIIIYGESGGGKTWLYKKVLDELSIPWEIIDCANVNQYNSIISVMNHLSNKRQQRVQVTESETKGVELCGILKHEDHYQILPQKDPIERYFSLLTTERTGSDSIVIIFDNLERIISSEKLMNELGNIITLLDNPYYAKYNVKLFIVGVPSNIRTYYEQTKNQSTIANRLIEIPEVSRLSEKQVNDFVFRGFVGQLKLPFYDEFRDSINNHIYYITCGIPLKIQEYCFILAQEFERNKWRITHQAILNADKKWLHRHLVQVSTVIDNLVYSKGMPNKVRIYVLYALGKIKRQVFWSSDIYSILKNECLKPLPSIKIISQILNEFCIEKNAIIKESSGRKGFYFTNPDVVMCIRTMMMRGPQRTIMFIDRPDIL